MEDTNLLDRYLNLAKASIQANDAAIRAAAIDNMRELRAEMSTPDLLWAEKSRVLLEAQLRRDAHAVAWFRRMPRIIRSWMAA